MNVIWHPFTQEKTAAPPLKVRSGKGARLVLDDGKELIDAISSWWVNVLGHAHPKIASAIYEQAKTLEHVIFAGFTHEPAEKLAELLVNLLPQDLEKVFFSDNGSTAVEVALKMAYQYFANCKEEKRQKFLCFEGAYHGDTIGAMSLCERSIFNRVFEKLLFEKISAPYPATHDDDPNVEEKEQKVLAFVEEELEKGTYAGVVIEPLVQGVAGMQMCRPEFLQQLEKVVKKSGTLLIYDEVMTGFGRTGEWFACEKSGTCPDIICLAKGISGGFLPLAVTVCSNKIYDAFYSTDAMKTFYHGHSYTANPLGCAAAVATLELLQEAPCVFKGMEKRHAPFLEELKGMPMLEKVRSSGTIVAMDLVSDEATNYLNPLGKAIRHVCFERGVLIRPLGNVIYLMPPYCITDEELEHVYQALADAIGTKSSSSISS